MNLNDDKGGKSEKRLLPPFILCSASVLLFLAGVYLPAAGVVLALIAPAPIALVGLRHGLRNAFVGLVFASALVYLPFGELATASFVLGPGILGVAIAAVAQKTKAAAEAMLLLVSVSVGAKLLFMFSMMSITGHNPFMFDEASLRAVFSSLPTNASDEAFTAMINQIPLLIPSFITLAAGLDAFVNYLLVSKLHRAVPALPPFEDWRFPRSLLVALLVSLILPLLEPDIGDSRVLTSVELNLKIIVNILFFIQGFSFVWWWMLRKKASRVVRFFIILVLLIPIFSMGLIALGIGDIWLNLRDRIDKAKGVKK